MERETKFGDNGFKHRQFCELKICHWLKSFLFQSIMQSVHNQDWVANLINKKTLTKCMWHRMSINEKLLHMHACLNQQITIQRIFETYVLCRFWLIHIKSPWIREHEYFYKARFIFIRKICQPKRKMNYMNKKTRTKEFWRRSSLCSPIITCTPSKNHEGGLKDWKGR